MTPRKPTAKKRRRNRKFDFCRAQTLFYQVLYSMRRMDFDLIQALTYAAGGGQDFQPSERKLLDLIRQNNEIGKDLREAEVLMRPYVKRALADPDAFRAAILSEKP